MDAALGGGHRHDILVSGAALAAQPPFPGATSGFRRRAKADAVRGDRIAPLGKLPRRQAHPVDWSPKAFGQIVLKRGGRGGAAIHAASRLINVSEAA